MSLKPLPQALITAAKLERQAADLLLLADELRASVGTIKVESSGIFKFGEVRQGKKPCMRKSKVSA